MLLAIVVFVFFLAGCVNGFLGFGAGIVGMTVLALTHDLVHAAGLVNIQSLLISGLMVWMLREHVLWKLTVPLLSTGLLGVFVGVWALGAIDPVVMTRLLGGVVVAIALKNLLGSGKQREYGPAWGAGAGLVAGVLQGAMNTGGPPVVAYLYGRPEPPDALKATTNVIFTAMALTRLPVAIASGQIGWALVMEAAVAVPALVVGSALGIRLSRRLAPERFRTVSWVAFCVLGVILVLKTL